MLKTRARDVDKLESSEKVLALNFFFYFITLKPGVE